jgi:hypothetical protein
MRNALTSAAVSELIALILVQVCAMNREAHNRRDIFAFA